MFRLSKECRLSEVVGLPTAGTGYVSSPLCHLVRTRESGESRGTIDG